MREIYKLPTPAAPTPKQRIQLPDDLSEVSDEELGDMLGHFTALQNYASYQATLVSNDIRVMEHTLDKLIKEQLPHMMGGITEKKARAQISPPVIRMRDSLIDKKNVFDLLESLVLNYERDFQAISREITRRSPGHGKT